MNWLPFQLVLRLHTPLHVGSARIGNVQRTRPYLLGRNLWGGLAMRLTRDRVRGASDAAYRRTGEEIDAQLAMSYFYPAVDAGQTLLTPKTPDDGFANDLLGSYASTALAYPHQAANPSTLHEVEYIAPYTRRAARPVYLVGTLFQRRDADPLRLNWQAAFRRMQLGGERSYGWGKVSLVSVNQISTQGRRCVLFADSPIRVDLANERPRVQVPKNTPFLAHTAHVPTESINGVTEPLVGRVWDGHDGRRLDYSGLYWLPGSSADHDIVRTIGRFGIWQPDD